MHPLHSNNLSGHTYLNGKWCCFDFETTNLDYGSALNPQNRIIMTSWEIGQGNVSAGMPTNFAGNPLDCPEFWQALDQADYWIAQNCKFEAHWLWRMGRNPTHKLWADPMLFEWVLQGNRKDKKDLDSLARKYKCGAKDEQIATIMDGGVCPSQIPLGLLRKRCRADVRQTVMVARRQINLLSAAGQLGCAVTRCLLAPILVDMERTGMQLDGKRVRETYGKYVDDYQSASTEFAKISDSTNPRSPDQMAHLLYDPQRLGFTEACGKRGRPQRNKPSKQFPDGRPKTDKTTISNLTAKTSRQRKFLDCYGRVGELGAALSKNLEFFLGVVVERYGHFHTELRQAITGTHRLSGGGRPLKFDMYDKPKRVQGQNMPRKFKWLFTTRYDDYYYEEADGKQLEFRIAAGLSQDPQMLADIRDPNFDAHLFTASEIYDLDYEVLLSRYRSGDARAKELRRQAKTHTFKPLYGGEFGTKEETRYYTAFRGRYRVFYAWSEDNLDIVESSGSLLNATGLRFYWDSYRNSQGELIARGTGKKLKPSVYNYPVQYMATGEIIPIAIIMLYYRVKKAALRVLFSNTVHDSVEAEVHKEDHPAWAELVKRAFTQDVYWYLKKVYGIVFKAPLGVELTWGTHWGEGETLEYDVEPEK